MPEKYRKHSLTSKRFLQDGSYVNEKEDPVTIWAIEILETESGVPLEAMELEAFATTDRTQQTSRVAFGRANLIIKNDRYIGSGLDVAFIMLEAMRPDKSLEGDEKLGWNYHFKQLNIYMSASPSERYAILTSGKYTVIYRRDLECPRALEPIGDLPKYESAREAAKHSPFTVILNPSEPDGIQTGLTPLTRDKFREVLEDTRSGCHSILREMILGEEDMA